MAMNAATKAQRSVQMPGRVVPKRRPSPERLHVKSNLEANPQYFGTASEDDESVELVASLQPKAARAKASKTVR
ncbi:uncharacterized protein B0H18DRAFT_1126895 [Fomitopsis serialis]|uniref:uncharacterized protein n=1 Tax=Fomitopsis serialis TaxID=139415 RepID=UPI002007EF7E|nr:uncharacterized protein B0H18DRAFT_1126895 [Neoantrodia serialis]KAH9912721.1 hypothetical protein B0H18DRAFT_1126895 [Neoantrodia serialis]